MSGWTKAGLTDAIPLPSGWRVRGVLPMLHTLIRRDLLPSHLLEVALRGADPKWLAEDEPEGKRSDDSADYIDALVAAFPRMVQAPDSDEWVPVALEAADLATMDQRDVDVMAGLVLRLKTPQDIIDGEAGSDPAEFRDELVGDAAREDVGDAAEPNAAGA